MYSDSGYSTGSTASTASPECPTKTTSSAAHTLAIYRSTLVDLEVKRMITARKGLAVWTSYWRSLYKPALALPLTQKLERTAPDLDRIFKEASHDIVGLIDETERLVAAARSPQEVDDELDAMRARVRRVVLGRQVRAAQLMEWLRCDIESIPVDIDDRMWAKLQRQVYGLDGEGHYHPSPEEPDSLEEERAFCDGIGEYVRQQAHLINIPSLGRLVELNP